MSRNTFYPQIAFVNAITNAKEAVTTFTEDHNFTLGEIVSFRVTSDFGMFQINNKHGLVIAKTSDTITVDIDSRDWDKFDYSALNSAKTTPPTVLPCCSGVVPGSKPPRINLRDTFDNRRA